MIKKLLKRVFIVLMITLAIMQPMQYKVNAQSKVDVVLARARSFIGSAQFAGFCQRFVRVSFEAVGIYGWAPSATDAGNYWIVSTSRDNIPVGATVYFTSNTQYGHVGIYTGNGCMIHAYNVVCEEPISDYWWSRFRGWGYQGGVAPDGSATVSTTPLVQKDTTNPVVSDAVIAFQADGTFLISGKASDNRGLDRVIFGVRSSGGDVKYYAGTINNGVVTSKGHIADFGYVEGNYTIAMTAVDLSGNQATCVGNTILADVNPPEIYDVIAGFSENDTCIVKYKIKDVGQVSSKSEMGNEIKYDDENGFYYSEYEINGNIVCDTITVTDSTGHTKSEWICFERKQVNLKDEIENKEEMKLSLYNESNPKTILRDFIHNEIYSDMYEIDIFVAA